MDSLAYATLLINFFKWIHSDFLRQDRKKHQIYDQIKFHVVDRTHNNDCWAINCLIVLQKWLMWEPDRLSSEYKSEREI